MRDAELIWRIDQELRARRQVLVEIGADTRWKRFDEPPVRGYALASNSVHSVLHDKHRYVTDINHDKHGWRVVEVTFPDLDAAARYLLERERQF